MLSSIFWIRSAQIYLFRAGKHHVGVFCGLCYRTISGFPVNKLTLAFPFYTTSLLPNILCDHNVKNKSAETIIQFIFSYTFSRECLLRVVLLFLNGCAVSICSLHYCLSWPCFYFQPWCELIYSNTLDQNQILFRISCRIFWFFSPLTFSLLQYINFSSRMICGRLNLWSWENKSLFS